MIDVVRVLEAVKKLTETADDEIFSIIPTVTVACTELSDRLKKSDFADDDRVVNAAVYLSYYRLLLVRVLTGECQMSFKAGDVTVSQSPSLLVENAAKLRDEALLIAQPLLEDMDFMFRQV